MTIARFRVRHEQALAGLLVTSLQLRAAAGMVRLGLVALDGTKAAATCEQLVVAAELTQRPPAAGHPWISGADSRPPL